MGFLRIPGTFRGVNLVSLGLTNFANQTLNVSDAKSQNPSGATARTQGATLVDRINFPTPTISTTPQIITVSIVAYLARHHAINPPPEFGLLGKIFAGLSAQATPSTQASLTAAFVTPVQPLPPDGSLISSLWDPAVDPMPPDVSAQSLLPITATIAPPIPLPITDQTQATVGIWMTPGLMQNSAGGPTPFLGIYSGTYTVVYDDGR